MKVFAPLNDKELIGVMVVGFAMGVVVGRLAQAAPEETQDLLLPEELPAGLGNVKVLTVVGIGAAYTTGVIIGARRPSRGYI